MHSGVVSKRSCQPRPFGIAGQTVLIPAALPGSPMPLRPTSSCERDDQDDDWRQMRASMKTNSKRIEQFDVGIASAGPGSFASYDAKLSSCTVGASVSSTPPGSSRRRRSGSKNCTEVPKPAWHQEEISDARFQRTVNELAARENSYLEKAKNDAKANQSAFFKDLIGFLELHGISGAYAMAFAANSIESLSQLLLMEETELNQLVERCDLDAMDEILLKEALRNARGE